MIEMTIKELFDVGVSFESAVGEGTKSERARIPKNYARINLPKEIESKIMNIDLELNFLISGEIWCPDFQINTTILKKFCDLNPNFNISVITMARGKKFLSPILNIDKENFKGPTIVVLDKNFNIIGYFEERPKAVKDVKNFDDIKLDYYKGKYILDSVNDLLDIICNI
ncbi:MULTISPECIES: thioredoxin family protein [Romboutsia]|uniref:thioredoxin family protein n=1 Tax=Romboutsia TaxID=1501226 RepID=UPI00189AD8C1|nr:MULTISPECIES: thioredoxin family protein [Romboutsia]MCH1960663.1 thioredoxin family protein [Romboutsia hominis]MCH1968905.1 thioredoxin family protein [Romboutsia hominis]MDB8791678.1 thioredoxin family protein [Romboutsia sp. 1001216sp1]MDB8793575.1 thioredoxin family protein [Romboutsia sp. 1001216sp1]MDB8794972.1 thioredoxin family protein [Romboutsia sp. 1001216sp1]